MTKDPMQLLAEARPARLDPDDHPDPARFMTGRPARPARRIAWKLALAPAAALAAVAAVVLGSVEHAPPPRSSAKPPSSSTDRPPQKARTVRDLLLAAAEQTGRQQETGAYWYTNEQDSERREVGPAGHQYSIMARFGLENWTSTDTHRPSVAAVRRLGAEPAGPADRAAWKADGSPRSWTQPGVDLVLSMDPGPRSVRRLAGDTHYLVGSANVTAAELAEAPAEPAALRSWVLGLMKRAQSEEPANYQLFWSAKALILDLPVRAPVRAAAYRMLADLSGARLIGDVTDQAGRPAVAVSFPDDETHSTRLLVDPATGQARGMESWYRNTRMRATVVVEAKYTDHPPA